MHTPSRLVPWLWLVAGLAGGAWLARDPVPVAAAGPTARRLADPPLALRRGTANLRVSADGAVQPYFTEISELGAELEVREFRMGGSATRVSGLVVGAQRPVRVTLVKAVSDPAPGLYSWWDDLKAGQPRRAALTVELLDNTQQVVRTWRYTAALPCAWELVYNDEGSLVEEVTFAATDVQTP